MKGIKFVIDAWIKFGIYLENTIKLPASVYAYLTICLLFVLIIGGGTFYRYNGTVETFNAVIVDEVKRISNGTFVSRFVITNTDNKTVDVYENVNSIVYDKHSYELLVPYLVKDTDLCITSFGRKSVIFGWKKNILSVKTGLCGSDEYRTQLGE